MSTADYTVKNALDDAEPNQIADALRKVALGTVLTPIIETITLASVRNHVHLLTDTVAKKAALVVQAVEVTNVAGGAADLGVRLVAPSGATPAAKGAKACGVATLSDDGDIITFEGTVKAIKVKYIPMPATALTDKFVAKS